RSVQQQQPRGALDAGAQTGQTAADSGRPTTRKDASARVHEEHAVPGLRIRQHTVQQRALAGAGRPGEAENLALRDRGIRACMRVRRSGRCVARVRPGVALQSVLQSGDRSMITFVDFTVATASAPTSRPSACTASELMSETTRNAPACNSTWAMTASRRMLVTIPGNRFRAL